MEIEGSIYLLEEQAGFEADATLVKVGSESPNACTAVRMRTAPADAGRFHGDTDFLALCLGELSDLGEEIRVDLNR
jgi:hypothetical protein